MIAGAPYANFSLEFIEQRKQVCDVPMAPFAERGLESWPEMESLLGSMLEKNTAHRISSLEKCINLLENMSIPRLDPKSSAAESKDPKSNDPMPFLRSFVGNELKNKLPTPNASLWWGASGLGYAFLRGAMFSHDPTLIREAQYFSGLSKKWGDDGDEGFFSEALETTAEVVGPISICHRSEGVSLLEALIAHSTGDSVALAKSINKFLTGAHRMDSQLEYCFGKAGLLNAIEQLTYLTSDNAELVRVGEDVFNYMLNQIGGFRSLKESPIQYAGFAHGWAGILYALLSWARNYNPKLVGKLNPYLHELAELKTETPAGVHWPLRLDRPAREGDIPSWCNGTAGLTLLWAEAYRATSEEKWLALACETGKITATHHDRYSSLCCGIAGRAFALVDLYQITGDNSWLKKAEWCLTRARTPANPHIHSLFKGITGLELARLEIRNPSLMSFPLLATKNYGPPIRIKFNQE
jgi:serine/threonine-protein kinase